MKTSSNKPKTKPGSEPKAKSDLQSMPMAELQAKLESSPDGLTQAEAAKRLARIRPQRDRGEEGQPVPQVPHLSVGSDPVDDRGGRHPLGAGPALAGLRHHPRPASGQRRGRILGRAPGRQRHRGAEGEAGGRGQGAAGRQMGHAAGARAGAGRRHPHASGRHRARRRPPARRRLDRGRSVRADGRVVARDAKTRRGRVLGLDRPPGRDQRARLCDRREHLFRQDGGAGAGGAHRQPFPARGAQDRRLPDHPGGGPGGRDHHRLGHPRRPDPRPLCSSPWC